MRGAAPDALGRVMAAWGLEADGAAFATHASTLAPVRRDGAALMLKLAHSLEEARGGRLMQAWGGAGAARVVARRGPALLMERASGGSLAGVEDAAATAAIVAVAGRLREARPSPPPRLVPLRRWFRALLPVRDGVLGECAAVARGLLDDPRAEGMLHGDLHHGNILDFGASGWKAIDPKGLWGDRGFEFAALFRNPDAGRALAPGRMARQAALVAELSGIPRARVLSWVAAEAGLSATWTLSDGGGAGEALAVARMALELRGR